MADFQDEEQWLYGDDKDDSNAKENEADTSASEKKSLDTPVETEETSKEIDSEELSKEPTEPETNGDTEETEQNQESQDAEQNGDKSRDDAGDGDGDVDGDGDDSSSDDEPTVTIGKIVKQPDIMRPPPPTHRAAPTSGLKDDDFTSTGKVNGVPAQDFSLQELEDKPWRKPGADLSDYFNYGFTEDTWIKYCERQKRMRNNESGVGLAGLGINVGKGISSGNIPVSIVNENSKYGGLKKVSGIPNIKPMDDGPPVGVPPPSSGNTIQVMTADRRTYSNKVMGGGPNYDDMDFGGGNPYGADFFSAPPPGYYNPPPPPAGPWGGIPNVPPPGWTPDGLMPPIMPPPHGNIGGYFDEDSMGPIGSGHSRASKDDRDRDRDRDYDKIRDSRDRDSREREVRHHSRRRSRSRSRSKSRHHKRSRTRSRSRSRSPSTHRHKRKKSKRERED